MIKLFDKVEILDKNITGIVVDISKTGKYIVEGDSKDCEEGAYGGEWPLYDCTLSELRKIETESRAQTMQA